MKDKRKIKYIGCRFSEEEKEQIEEFIREYNKKSDKDLNLSDFLRESVFSHMYHLQHPELYYDHLDFKTNLVKLEKIINRFKINID